MARKRMFSDEEKQAIIDYYLSGKSTVETAVKFNITSGTVNYLLKKKNVPRRTVSEGNSLKWKDSEFRVNQVLKRKGKSSGALGKTWYLKKPKTKSKNCGENHKWWKGGRTSLTPKIKDSAEYRFWRMAVLRRDFFTCQLCGAKNKKGEKYIFHVDHIYPFSKILDDYNITTLEEAIFCEALWDTENGRTLCKDCHKQTPTWGRNLTKNAL